MPSWAKRQSQEQSLAVCSYTGRVSRRTASAWMARSESGVSTSLPLALPLAARVRRGALAARQVQAEGVGDLLCRFKRQVALDAHETGQPVPADAGPLPELIETLPAPADRRPQLFDQARTLQLCPFLGPLLLRHAAPLRGLMAPNNIIRGEGEKNP